jgi:hypothetical protein
MDLGGGGGGWCRVTVDSRSRQSSLHKEAVALDGFLTYLYLSSIEREDLKIFYY